MTHPPYRAFSGVIVAGALVLAACASAPTRFFTLDAVPPGAASPAAAYAGPPVKLLAVHIPPALDRDELVSETGAGEMRVHDLEHWEAPLGLTARQALIQDLAARLPSGAVLGPSEPGGDGVATLSADVVSFQAGPQGATMQAAWTLTLPAATGAPEPLVYRAPLALLTAPAAGEGGQATATAFSALLGRLSDDIAAELPAQAERMRMEQAQAQAQAAARAAAIRVRTTTRTTSTATAAAP